MTEQRKREPKTREEVEAGLRAAGLPEGVIASLMRSHDRPAEWEANRKAQHEMDSEVVAS